MAIRNTHEQWGIVSMGIHWVTVLVVFALFILGLWMVELSYYDSWYRKAPYIHKSVGVLLLILTVFRLFWRWKNVMPNTFSSHTKIEQRAASLTHIVMYLLLITIMLSGYLISTADGRPVEVFGLFELPATLHGLDKQEDVAGIIHLSLAISLISLVVIHALAAVKHHVVDRDRTLLRMLGK